jgi:hypothetical protein
MAGAADGVQSPADAPAASSRAKHPVRGVRHGFIGKLLRDGGKMAANFA